MADNKDNMKVLGSFLGIVCALAACILAFTSTMTKAAITRNLEAKNSKALEEILPSFDNQPDKEKATFKDNGVEVIFFPATKDGRLVGIAAQAESGKGFGGKLTVMASLTPEGAIDNVIVTRNNETPGLGTVVTDRKLQKNIAQIFSSSSQAESKGLPPNPVLDSFRGQNANAAPWKVRKDGGTVESITGATISSRAVADAMNIIAETFEKHKNEILRK